MAPKNVYSPRLGSLFVQGPAHHSLLRVLFTVVAPLGASTRLSLETCCVSVRRVLTSQTTKERRPPNVPRGVVALDGLCGDFQKSELRSGPHPASDSSSQLWAYSLTSAFPHPKQSLPHAKYLDSRHILFMVQKQRQTHRIYRNYPSI